MSASHVHDMPSHVAQKTPFRDICRRPVISFFILSCFPLPFQKYNLVGHFPTERSRHILMSCMSSFVMICAGKSGKEVYSYEEDSQ